VHDSPIYHREYYLKTDPLTREVFFNQHPAVERWLKYSQLVVEKPSGLTPQAG
jgi:hypothetical protein